MGSLVTIEENEVLTVRTYKTIPNAEIAWANTYELVSNQTISDTAQAESALNTLKSIFETLERDLLITSYVLDRIVISTYVADGTPYDPFTFTSFTVGRNGQYGSGFEPLLPLQFCALVKRIVAFGRQGNILYRGIVNANDADITASGTIIRSRRISQINNVLDAFRSALSQNGWQLVMASGEQQVDPTTLRFVSNLNIKPDMRFKKLKNRYFDKLRNTNT